MICEEEKNLEWLEKSWIKDIIFGDDNASETLRKVADGPKRNVITWQGYYINKFSFYTKGQDEE